MPLAAVEVLLEALSFLNGRELMQIALGVRDISFRFDEDVAISVKES